MAIRNLTKNLRCNDSVVNAVCRGTACQRRTFTSSTAGQKHGRNSKADHLSYFHLTEPGAVPAFTESSNVELDALLSTVRKTVFLPSHLSKPHRQLTFGSRYKKTLEEEPVKVEIKGEEFKISHVDRTKDVPNAKKSLFRAVELMEDKKDWDNLPILLEGLKTSGKVFKMMHLQKLVRLAAMAGRQDIILECARRGAKTGFVLNNSALVREVMWWIQYKAMASNWSATDTKKALSMAETVSVLLEDAHHAGASRIGSPSDPRIDAEVLGTLLELAVAEAKLNDGKDVEGKVKTYAERLAAVTREDPKLHSTLPVITDKVTRNFWLRRVSPVVFGMKGAVEILGTSSAATSQLQNSFSFLEGEALKQRGLLIEEDGEGTLGSKTYDTLIGLKAWAQ